MNYKRIWITGHNGMVGSAMVRRLCKDGVQTVTAHRSEVDLTDRRQVEGFVAGAKPDAIVFCAGRVGGIQANMDDKAGFLAENAQMALVTIQAAMDAGIRRLVYLGSTCVYPAARQDGCKEGDLLADRLEPSNEGYALAKIVGIKLCEYIRRQYGLLYHSVMPTNLYGLNDNYHPTNSHVIPALIRRICHAHDTGLPAVAVWGTGKEQREFLHVNDLADAIVHLLGLDYPPHIVNVGTGQAIEIMEVAKMIAGIVGYQGKLVAEPSKPSGVARKVSDVSLMTELGWTAKRRLWDGLYSTVADYRRQASEGTVRRS